MRNCGAADGDGGDYRYATDDKHAAYAKGRGRPGSVHSQAATASSTKRQIS